VTADEALVESSTAMRYDRMWAGFTASTVVGHWRA
jgi:hypothetical protein